VKSPGWSHGVRNRPPDGDVSTELVRATDLFARSSDSSGSRRVSSFGWTPYLTPWPGDSLIRA